MWLIFELLLVWLKIIYYWAEAVFRAVVRPPKKNIEGQIVLITGAGGGIGRKLSLEFAAHGAKLVLWDINKDTNEETAAQVRALGKVAHTYVCDLSSKDDIYRVGAKVQREVGPVDILVNNAGILSGRKLLNLKDEDIERTMKINTLAHFWTIRSFLPRMLERNKGHIVNITSLAGSFPTANLTDYCASKFGATGLSHSLALELHQMGRDDIKLTCVQPYTVNTGLVWHPESRFPSLYPTLEVDYVAKEIVAGTLRDEPLVVIPRAVVLNYALAGLMPIKAGYVLYDFLRVGVGEHIPGEEKKSGLCREVVITMSLISRVLVVFLFILGGCFPIVIRRKKLRRKGRSCSCTEAQTTSQESFDSLDSMSVEEPTTWQMPYKGRKRIRTISGASNFSGVSTMSNLSERDRMWLQAFRFAGR